MKIKTIIFDAYGTLFDTGNGSVRATEKILREAQSKLNPTVFYRKWKLRHREIIQELDTFISEADVFERGLSVLYKEYGIEGDAGKGASLMLSTLGIRNIFLDVKECLDLLTKKYEVVIASNTDTSPFLADLQRNELDVSQWVTSESLRAYKPHRLFYERMLSEIERLPEEIIFVGDSLEADVIGPQECGMRSIWLNRTKEPVEEGQDFLEIFSLAELPKLIATEQ